MKQKFDVTGMSCSACSNHVEKAVNRLQGINQVSVNLLTNSMLVDYNETVLSQEKIIEAVKEEGYGATVAQEDIDENVKKN